MKTLEAFESSSVLMCKLITKFISKCNKCFDQDQAILSQNNKRFDLNNLIKSKRFDEQALFRKRAVHSFFFFCVTFLTGLIVAHRSSLSIGELASDLLN